MGEEEKKNIKEKEEQKKETGSRAPTSYLDHLVASYDPHGSYRGPILNPPPPPRGKGCSFFVMTEGGGGGGGWGLVWGGGGCLGGGGREHRGG